MVTLMVLVSSILVLMANYGLFRFVSKIGLDLKIALSFLLSSIMIIYLINEYGAIPIENLSTPDVIDKIVSWNYGIKKVQNSVILVSLVGLVYGLRSEYQSSKKNIFMVGSRVVLLLTLVFIYMIMSQL